jgi:hypothetical protein
MISALGTAAYALGQQLDRFNRSAARVARGGGDGYVQEVVEQMSATHAAAANVAVIRATDELVGSLFHIVA